MGICAGYSPANDGVGLLGRMIHLQTPGLTHNKCYRGWAVDRVSDDTLTHIHGYPNGNMSLFAKREVLASIHVGR